MAQERKPNSRVAFGPFEADLHTGELRKRGVKLRLAEQPFQILATLLERPCELVTREQLKEQLWSEDTFVAFDDGLNAAVNKLRQTLGDSARDPKYIETLQGRGYRFVGEIDQADVDGVIESEPPSIKAAAADGVGPEELVLKRKLRLYQALLGLTGVVALSLAFVHFRETPLEVSEPSLRKFALRTPVPLRLFARTAISPNGRHIAFVRSTTATDERLWVHDFDQHQSRAIDETEGALDLFWAPGSDFIGFATQVALKKLPLQGGPAVQLCQLPCTRFNGGVWSTDGEVILFSCNEVIYEVPARGGSAKPLILPEASGSEGRRSWAASEPGFFLASQSGTRALVYVSRMGAGVHMMIARDLETGREQVLGPGVKPSYSPSGHIVYQAEVLEDNLWALPFSPDTLRATGTAFPIVQNGNNPTVASDGTLAYLDTSGATRDELVWLDRRGEQTGKIGQLQGRVIPGLTLSPNGQLVAGSATEASGHGLWTWHIGRSVKTRFPLDAARDVIPIWSPTGQELAFSSFRSGNFDVLLRQANGTGEAIALLATPRDEFVTDWSRDGKYLFYVVEGPKTGEDIWYLESKEDGSGWEPNPFLQMPSNQTAAKLSPDGRYVVYVSEESGQREIYVQSFPEGGRKITVSSNGGVQPRWSRDGKELFYVEGSSLMAVAVSTVPSFSLGPAKRLFEHPSFTAAPVPQYDVSADGERFVVAEPVGETSIRIVQNWFAEFKDREQD